MSNGLYNGQFQGLSNGLLEGSANGLCDGLQNEKYIYPKGSIIGNIFQDNFDRASLGGNYTVTGVASFATDGSKLTTSGGVGGFANYMTRSNWATCLEKHTITCDFSITSAIGASSFGLAFGVRSINPSDLRSYAIQVQTSSGANLGKTFIYSSNGGTYTLRQTSTSGLTINQNDLLRIVITRNLNVISWKMYNLTLGTSYSEIYTYSLSFAAGAWVTHNTGYYVIHSVGGTLDITNYRVDSFEKQNVKNLFIGASIDYGLFADSISNRIVNKLMGENNSYVLSAGGSDKTAEILAKINELVLINAKNVIFVGCGNDITFSVSSGTYQANYNSIISRLRQTGARIIHCYATPRSVDMTAWNTFLSTFSNKDLVITETWDLLRNSGLTTLQSIYDGGDAAHLNSLGHAKVADIIYNKAGIFL